MWPAPMNQGSLWGMLSIGVLDLTVWWPQLEGGSRHIWLEGVTQCYTESSSLRTCYFLPV